MENAAKALTIAGGILIAIIVITTLVFSMQQWGIIPKAQEQNEESRQLSEFNRDFESYNKQNLYGADILSVLNKAIDNNDKYGISNDPSDPYFMNVKIIFKKDVYPIKITHTTYRDENGILHKETGDPVEDTLHPLIYGDSSGHPYELSNPGDRIDLNRIRSLDKVMNETSKKTKDPSTGVETFIRIETYPGETNFRIKRYFRCIEVSRNPQNGRICKMVFEEVLIGTLYDQNGDTV